jgi:transcriptional repressor NrdR
MDCPYCGAGGTRVLESRTADDALRRRRNCTGCGQRFTTYERLEAGLTVVKRDGSREPFSREKLARSILLAWGKRPAKMERIQRLISGLQAVLLRRRGREVPTRLIGSLLLERLREVDEVAYLRYASVYRKFSDVKQLAKEAEKLSEARSA